MTHPGGPYNRQYEKLMEKYRDHVSPNPQKGIPDHIQSILDHYFATYGPELLTLREVLSQKIEQKRW